MKPIRPYLMSKKKLTMIGLEVQNEWEVRVALDDLNDDLMPLTSEIYFHSFLVEDFRVLGENMLISVKISKSV